MKIISAIAIVLNALAAATAAQVPTPVPLTETERAARTGMPAFLRSALMREAPVEPERLDEALRSALVDNDAVIREAALATIAARNLGPTLQRQRIDVKEEWQREQPVMQRLRPMITRALDDQHSSVRQAAVGALQSLDYDGSRPYGSWLSAETTAMLVALYRREQHPTVRTVVVAVLGGSARQNPAAHATLRDATRDAAPSVRELAVRALAELER